MATYYHVLFFSLIGGVFSLIGGFLLVRKETTARALAKYATPFAAGALLAAVFLDLLKEGLHQAEADTVLLSAVVGIILFFFAERFLHWFHHHHEHKDSQDATTGLIVAGDTIHNALDGVAIAAAFLVSVPTGIVTTIAVAAHEIPQEIGDFGLLLHKGMARKKVLLVNLLSAVATTVAALVTFSLGSSEELPIGVLLGLSAGFLLYIAMSDVIPEIHENASSKKLFDAQPILLLLGVIVVGLTINLTHNYISSEDDHQHTPGTESSHNHAHGSSEIEDHDLLPSFKMTISKDSDGKTYNLGLDVERFVFAPEGAGKANVVGHGHVHLYVNGEKRRLYSPWYHLGELQEGTHLRVVLITNDHKDIIHDDLVLAAELVLDGSQQQTATDPFYDFSH